MGPWKGKGEAANEIVRRECLQSEMRRERSMTMDKSKDDQKVGDLSITAAVVAAALLIELGMV